MAVYGRPTIPVGNYVYLIIEADTPVTATLTVEETGK
jgi:hypothetical protein